MEPRQKSKLWNDSTVTEFVTGKWIDVLDLSNGQYSVKKNIRFETSTLWSDLSNYSGAYIVVKGTINIEDTNANNSSVK